MDEAKLIQLGRVTASGVLSNKPCLIYSICGIGLAQTDNTYSIYDGSNSEGKLIMRMVAGAYASDFRLYAVPLFFSQGLYIEFTTNGEEVFAQILELSR